MQARVIVIAATAAMLSIPRPVMATHGGFDVLVDDNLVPCVAAVPIVATIQAGVNAAAAGDRVGVCPGTYVEEVDVATAGLTIEGIGAVHLVAPAGPGPKFGFEIVADGVTIRRFDISGYVGNQSCAIQVTAADNVSVLNNSRIHDNDLGVCVDNSAGTRARNNLLEGNTIAAVLARTVDDFEASGNTLRSNGEGITVLLSSLINVHHNAVDGGGAFGVAVEEATDVVVSNNAVRGTDGGILVATASSVTVRLNSAIGNLDGISLESVHGCLVERNNATLNEFRGIGLFDVDECHVVQNRAYRNGDIDCFWDGAGNVAFERNACGTELPPGAWH